MKTNVDLRTVDLSAYPDLVVIYLGMRVRTFPGIKTLLVDAFHPAPHQTDLMPKSGAVRIAHETLLPLAMRRGTGPALRRSEIAPVPAHPEMQGVEPEDDIVLIMQQAVRPSGTRLVDLRTEAVIYSNGVCRLPGARWYGRGLKPAFIFLQTDRQSYSLNSFAAHQPAEAPLPARRLDRPISEAEGAHFGISIEVLSESAAHC